MRTLRFGSPEWTRWRSGLPRAGSPRPALRRVVAAILREVRRDGDAALVRLTARFDGVRLSPGDLFASEAAVRAQAARAEPRLRRAIDAMAGRIEAFHRRQRETGFRLVLPDGSVLAERVRPLDSVGLYVPGGAGAYPSSVLMNAIPARVAGVPRVLVATPPRALTDNPAVAAALVRAGLAGSVLRVGGAQAVAALAFGTASVDPVAKIVGPGNAFVAEAKRQVRGTVEVDQEAGPSEVVVLADGEADPAQVAIDLLAQAEHGSGLEVVVLVTPSLRLAEAVRGQLLELFPRAANSRAAARALRQQGAMVLVRDLAEGVAAVNALAPEHVEVLTRGAARVARDLVGGAVFVGPFAPVAVGDYGVGPNHVLPTGGSARSASPLSVRDFVRRQSVVQMSARGLRRVGPGMAAVARAEGFTAHAASIDLRTRGRR